MKPTGLQIHENRSICDQTASLTLSLIEAGCRAWRFGLLLRQWGEYRAYLRSTFLNLVFRLPMQMANAGMLSKAFLIAKPKTIQKAECKDCALESMNPFDQKSWADVPFAKRGLAQDPTVPAPVRKGACAGPMQSESLQLAAGAMDDPPATARPAASADASTTGGVDAEDQNGSWSQREWQDRAWHAWQTDGQSRGQANGTAAASPTAGAVETRAVTAQGGADPLLASDPWATSRTSSTPAAAPSSSAPAATPWLPATITTSDSAAMSNGWSWSWRSQWDQWGSHGWTRDDGWQSSSWSSTHYKGDFSDPPAWPGWSHRRYWIAAVQRWNKNSDIPVEKRSEKILRSLGWEPQADFEHIPESVLCTSAYLDIIIQVLNNKAGVQEDDEKRRAFKSAISENSRRRDETLAQFAVRRLQDFSKAAAFGVVIPNEFKATMLREGAGLNDQNMQNLASLLRDDENNPDAVAKVLSRLDLRADRVTGFASHADTQESYTYMYRFPRLKRPWKAKRTMGTH